MFGGSPLKGTTQPEDFLVTRHNLNIGSLENTAKGADKILPERKKDLKGNVKEIILRMKRKEESIRKGNSGDQIETKIIKKKDYGDPHAPTGKVKNLVLDLPYTSQFN